jgi:hypothetical protein
MTERTSNAEVARAFRLLADLLEIGGESGYRASAYPGNSRCLPKLGDTLVARNTRSAATEDYQKRSYYKYDKYASHYYSPPFLATSHL